MSMDLDEIMRDEAYGGFLEQVAKDAIENKIIERLGAYYDEHPHVVDPAFKALEEAKSLIPDHPSAALVFAAIAFEVGLIKSLIAPIIYGMVHMETAAVLIVDLILKNRGIDKFKEILENITQNPTIVEKNHKINPLKFKRNGSQKTLWEEMRYVYQRRNAVVHNSDNITQEEADTAIAVASSFLNNILKVVIEDLGCGHIFMYEQM